MGKPEQSRSPSYGQINRRSNLTDEKIADENARYDAKNGRATTALEPKPSSDHVRFFMPFGLHRGKTLDRVPTEYLVWIRDLGTKVVPSTPCEFRVEVALQEAAGDEVVRRFLATQTAPRKTPSSARRARRKAAALKRDSVTERADNEPRSCKPLLNASGQGEG